ncbi:MAG TPA: hypothetical protein VNR62_04585, partial [Cellulomonas sp.]|nr:hypothetical protein [Cellulomonas sp.]
MVRRPPVIHRVVLDDVEASFLGTSDTVSTVTSAIGSIAIVALVAVLVLMARQRREVHRANTALALSRELRHRYDAL